VDAILIATVVIKINAFMQKGKTKREKKKTEIVFVLRTHLIK